MHQLTVLFVLVATVVLAQAAPALRSGAKADDKRGGVFSSGNGFHRAMHANMFQQRSSDPALSADRRDAALTDKRSGRTKRFLPFLTPQTSGNHQSQSAPWDNNQNQYYYDNDGGYFDNNYYYDDCIYYDSGYYYWTEDCYDNYYYTDDEPERELTNETDTPDRVKRDTGRQRVQTKKALSKKSGIVQAQDEADLQKLAKDKRSQHVRMSPTDKKTVLAHHKKSQVTKKTAAVHSPHKDMKKTVADNSHKLHKDMKKTVADNSHKLHKDMKKTVVDNSHKLHKDMKKTVVDNSHKLHKDKKSVADKRAEHKDDKRSRLQRILADVKSHQKKKQTRDFVSPCIDDC